LQGSIFSFVSNTINPIAAAQLMKKHHRWQVHSL